jgi:hypothetical protein
MGTSPDGRNFRCTRRRGTGQRTMGEMHRTLGALRDDDGAEPSPPPSLDALDSLLDNARAAGVPVTVAVEGAPRPLVPSLDASAFRIVQEAVTKVVRHAGGAGASVTVRYLPADLELIVADEGTAITTSRPRAAYPVNACSCSPPSGWTTTSSRLSSGCERIPHQGRARPGPGGGRARGGGRRRGALPGRDPTAARSGRAAATPGGRPRA